MQLIATQGDSGMKTTIEPNVREIVRTNKKLTYKALGSLRDEGIRRIWATHLCKDQMRSAVKMKQFSGGWAFYYTDYEGVRRPSDIAIQFGGSNGILQERNVANRIIDALRSEGLYVEWQGGLRKKILVDVSRPARKTQIQLVQPVQPEQTEQVQLGHGLWGLARRLQSICKGGERSASTYLFRSEEL